MTCRQTGMVIVRICGLLGLFPGRRGCTLYSRLEHTMVSVPSGVTRNVKHISVGRRVRFVRVTFNSLDRIVYRVRLTGSLGCVATGRVVRIRGLIESVTGLLSKLHAGELGVAGGAGKVGDSNKNSLVRRPRGLWPMAYGLWPMAHGGAW